MGHITKINVDEVNSLIFSSDIKIELLKDTKNGITDSTFICFDEEKRKYILKIYENSTFDEVEDEISILKNLNTPLVPIILSPEIMVYKGKPCVLFSYIQGKIPKRITKKQISEISCFIAFMHKSKIKPKTKNIYSKEYFLSMMNKLTSNKNEFEERYKLINEIDLSSNSFIHGDLFPDNSKFIDDKLSGVYDFGQSCYGNSKFDLSVLVVSWCFDNYDFNHEFYETILNKYNLSMNENITIKNLKPYLLYSCLYYSLQRLTRINNLKDHNEYILKFDIINEFL